MQHMFNKSKFCIPKKDAGIFISERVETLQKHMSEYDAVTICAPAGYGKSTLASIYASNLIKSKYKACWYRIEKQDAELSVFFSNLIYSVFYEETAADVLLSYLNNQTEIEEKKYYLAAQFCQALWELENQSGHTGITLFLDDFHLIDDNDDIFQVVSYVLRYAPQSFRLIIVSRKKYEVQTDIKIKKALLELEAEDLTLSIGETAELIENLYDLKIEDALKKTIYKKTSGWVAGVILLSRFIYSNNRKALKGMLEKDIPQEDIFRYIAHEILDYADSRLKTFLVKIVILNEFTLSEASEILEMDDAGILIAQCEKQGFVIQKALETGTVYSFHALFQDAITSIQEKFISKAEIKAVALKAAEYYMHRDIFKAVEYYIKCGETARVLEVVEKYSKQYILLNKINYARRWLVILDDTIINQSSGLLYLKALVLQHIQPDTSVALLESAFRIASGKRDIMLQLRTTIALMHVYSLKGDKGNITKTFLKFPVSSIIKHFSTLRMVFTVILLGKAAYEDNIQNGLSHLLSLEKQSVVLSGHDGTDTAAANKLERDFYWAYLGYSVMIYFRLGDFDKVDETIAKILKLPDIAGGIENDYILQYSISLKYYRKETASAWKLANELLERSEISENDYFTAHSYLYMSRLKHDENDFVKASDFAQLAVKFYLSAKNPSSALNAALEKCLFMSDSRMYSTHAVLEQAEDTILSLTKNRDELDERCLSIYALLMMEAGKYESAEKALFKCMRALESKKAKLSLCSTLFFLGSLYYKKNEKEKSLYYIEKALGIAFTEGYKVFENMHFHTFVLIALISYNHRIYTAFLEELIYSWFGASGLEYFVKNVANSKWDYYESFSNFFIDSFMKKDKLSNKAANITVNTLGHFSIVINGMEIKASEWKTRKNQAVLKYLLLNTGTCVAREKIAGVLWPDADKKSSSASLRVALSEIRKVLGKFGVSNGTRPLLDETIDGLEINLNPSLKIDFLELAGIYNLYNSLSEDNLKNEAVRPLLESAAALYKGEFLPEDQYEDWTTVKREQFKSIFIKLAIELADIYMNNKDYVLAENLLYKVMAADMYSEEACKRIAKIYEYTNQKGRVIQFLADFSERYKKEFNALPSEVNDLAVYKNIKKEKR